MNTARSYREQAGMQPYIKPIDASRAPKPTMGGGGWGDLRSQLRSGQMRYSRNTRFGGQKPGVMPSTQPVINSMEEARAVPAQPALVDQFYAATQPAPSKSAGGYSAMGNLVPGIGDPVVTDPVDGILLPGEGAPPGYGVSPQFPPGADPVVNQPAPDTAPLPPQQSGSQQSSAGGGFTYNYTGPTMGGGASAQSVSPTLQEVEQNQLMSYHLNNILDHDSDFMRRAAQMGIDRASARGLGNSSIAAGNAMGAMIDRAMPIAGFDASRYGRVGDLNQQQENMMNAANADRALQASMFNAQNQLAWSQFNHGRQMDQWNAQRGDRALDAQLYGGMFQSYFGALSAIYNNPNLTAEQQNAAAQNLGDMYPGFANQAWGAIPPELLSGNAIPAAQMMPPMGPINP